MVASLTALVNVGGAGIGKGGGAGRHERIASPAGAVHPLAEGPHRSKWHSEACADTTPSAVVPSNAAKAAFPRRPQSAVGVQCPDRPIAHDAPFKFAPSAISSRLKPVA